MGLDIYFGKHNLRKNNSLMTFIGLQHNVTEIMGDNSGLEKDIIITQEDIKKLKAVVEFTLRKENIRKNIISSELYPMKGCFYGPYCSGFKNLSDQFNDSTGETYPNNILKLDGNQYDDLGNKFNLKNATKEQKNQISGADGGFKNRKGFYQNIKELQKILENNEIQEGDKFNWS